MNTGLHGLTFFSWLFGETRGQNLHRFDARFAAADHFIGDGFGGNNQYCQVYRFGNRVDGGIGLQTLDFVKLTVDGVKGTGKIMHAHDVENTSAQNTCVFGGTDNGNGFRPE